MYLKVQITDKNTYLNVKITGKTCILKYKLQVKTFTQHVSSVYKHKTTLPNGLAVGPVTGGYVGLRVGAMDGLGVGVKSHLAILQQLSLGSLW